MKVGIVAAVVVLGAGFFVGRAIHHGADRDEPVAARLYTFAYADGVMEAAHGEDRTLHGIYLPMAHVAASLKFRWVFHESEPSEEIPRLSAYPGERPEGDGVGLYGPPTAIEETSIPADLAKQIEDLAALNRRHDEEGQRLGAEVARRLSLAPIPREPAASPTARGAAIPTDPSASAGVVAKKYRIRVYESVTDWSHGGGAWVHGIYLPEAKIDVILNFLVRYDSDGEYHQYPRLFARPGEMTEIEAADRSPNWLEDIRIPGDLTERILALAALSKRCDEESLRLGRDVRTRLNFEPIPNPNGQ